MPGRGLGTLTGRGALPSIRGMPAAPSTAHPIPFEQLRHWAALFHEDDPRPFAEQQLNALFAPGGAKLLTHEAWVHAVGRGERIHFSALFRRSAGAPLEVIATYPYTEPAYTWDLTIEELDVDEVNGAQGRLLGRVGPARIAVLDTLFFRNRDRYQQGQVVRIQVSALAYQLEPEALDGLYAPDFAGFFPRSALDATAGHPQNEIEVHSVVSRAEEVTLGDRAMARYELTLARLGPEQSPLITEVFAAGPRRFSPGDRVTGVLSLFGFVPEPGFPPGG